MPVPWHSPQRTEIGIGACVIAIACSPEASR
jgi:hypothetical protein